MRILQETCIEIHSSVRVSKLTRAKNVIGTMLESEDTKTKSRRAVKKKTKAKNIYGTLRENCRRVSKVAVNNKGVDEGETVTPN